MKTSLHVCIALAILALTLTACGQMHGHIWLSGKIRETPVNSGVYTEFVLDNVDFHGGQPYAVGVIDLESSREVFDLKVGDTITVDCTLTLDTVGKYCTLLGVGH